MFELVKENISIKFMLYITGIIAALLLISSFTQITVSGNNLEKTLKEGSVAFTELSKDKLVSSYIKYKESWRLKVEQEARKLLEMNKDLKGVQIFKLEGSERVFYFNENMNSTVFDSSYKPSEELAEKIKSLDRNVDSIQTEDKEYIQVISPYKGSFGSRKYSVRYLFSHENINRRVKNLQNIMIGITALAIFLGGISAIVLAKYITKPINDLSEKSEKASKGAVDVRVTVDREDEIGKLSDSIKRLLTTIRILQERDVPASERRDEEE